jgi:hypothetical protein
MIPIWTYTHSWRQVKRSSWGRAISVLASCEALEQARAAMKRGYAAAVVVVRHPQGGKAWRDRETGIRVIPCPEQTRGIVCTSCRLCWREKWLKESRTVIGFEVHGSVNGQRKVVEKLVQLALPLERKI